MSLARYTTGLIIDRLLGSLARAATMVTDEERTMLVELRLAVANRCAAPSAVNQMAAYPRYL